MRRPLIPSLLPAGTDGAPTTLAYRGDIDGLRSLAVALVVLFHFGLGPFGGGFVGVDVFFVVSGFLIVSVLAGARGRFLGDFLERRLRRLLPALLVMLAAACLCATRLLPGDLKTIGLALVAAATFTSNLYFVRLADDYFAAGLLAADPALHTWSLGVEAQFYLAMALLWAAGEGRPRLRGAAMGLLGVAAFAASLWAVARRPEAAFYLTPLRFWEFMIGAAITRPAMRWESRATVGSVIASVAVAAGLALIVLAAVLETVATPFPGAAALPPCLGAALVIRGGSVPNRASRWLGAGLARAGRLSYAVYLWHWPILVFAVEAWGGPLPLAARAGLLVPTLLLAGLTYRFVERPLIARRLLARPKPFLAACAAGLVGVALAGLVLNLAGQNLLVLRRFPPAVRQLAEGQFDASALDCPVRAEPDPACRFGAPGTEASLVLWGNSFARMWLPALQREAARRGVAGLALVIPRCPPLPGVEPPGPRDCAGFDRAALAFIAAHPALRTVVLGGNWSAFADDLPVLRATAAGLVARGRRVVIILSPPPVAYPVPRTLARAALHDRPPPPLAREEDALRARGAERAAVAAMAPAVPVTAIDPFRAFCDGLTCAVAAEGRTLYYDDEHVTRYGAERAAAVFAPVFAEGVP